jgi:hypothetical protein
MKLTENDFGTNVTSNWRCVRINKKAKTQRIITRININNLSLARCSTSFIWAISVASLDASAFPHFRQKLDSLGRGAPQNLQDPSFSSALRAMFSSLKQCKHRSLCALVKKFNFLPHSLQRSATTKKWILCPIYLSFLPVDIVKSAAFSQLHSLS